MGVRRLVLTAYRNYSALDLACDGRSVVLTGYNGSGKTNILESLSYLAPGRGLRRAKYSDIKSTLCPDALLWGVWAAVGDQNDGGWHIGTQVDFKDSKEKRLSKVNGHVLKTQMALGEYLTFLWLTPQMDPLFQDGATLRRRFLDRLVYAFNPAHGTLLNRYDHVMKERIGLLESYGTSPVAGGWLDTLEHQMANLGATIQQNRSVFLDQLMDDLTQKTSAFPTPLLHLDEKNLSVDWREGGGDFAHILARNRSADAAAGTTTAGPHKCDLKVWFESRDRPASHCSTGEQKALLLSIILGTARLRKRHYDGVLILLLDEVVAHLDPRRRRHLFDEIVDMKIQAWMTGTDPIFFHDLGDQAQHFVVDMGQVRPG
jgi:DNA replication and repair protein RecF